MNGQVAQETSIGETLPLFDGWNYSRERTKVSLELVQSPLSLADPSADRHMHVAWQLSKALKAVKSGRKAGRNMARLTPVQRHQVGNAICEHLLASLRQQVISEQARSSMR